MPQLYRCGNFQLLLDLQWGRNFIVAEMRNQSALFLLLQWGRNFIVAEIQRRVAYDAAVLQWGRNFIVAEILCSIVFYDSITMPMLQWGRNFIVAEIHGARATSLWSSPSFNGAATLSLRK